MEVNSDKPHNSPLIKIGCSPVSFCLPICTSSSGTSWISLAVNWTTARATYTQTPSLAHFSSEFPTTQLPRNARDNDDVLLYFLHLLSCLSFAENRTITTLTSGHRVASQAAVSPTTQLVWVPQKCNCNTYRYSTINYNEYHYQVYTVTKF
jgi:hypothetical protein